MTKKFFGMSLTLILTVTFLAGTTAPFFAQEAKERLAIETAERDGPATEGLTVEHTTAPRLPNGYKDVVTGIQRAEIAKIQKTYNALINLLQHRVRLLQMERDKKVDALLDETQVKRLRETREYLESEKYFLEKEKKPAAGTQKADASAH